MVKMHQDSTGRAERAHHPSIGLTPSTFATTARGKRSMPHEDEHPTPEHPRPNSAPGHNPVFMAIAELQDEAPSPSEGPAPQSSPIENPPPFDASPSMSQTPTPPPTVTPSESVGQADGAAARKGADTTTG